MMRLGKSVNIMDPDSALMPAGYGSMHSRTGGGLAGASAAQSMRSMMLASDSMRSGAAGAAGFGGGWGDWQSNAGASQKSMAVGGMPGSPSGLERGGSRSYDRWAGAWVGGWVGGWGTCRVPWCVWRHARWRGVWGSDRGGGGWRLYDWVAAAGGAWALVGAQHFRVALRPFG